MKKFLVIALVLGISLTACKEKEVYVEPEVAEVVVPVMQYGFDLNNYEVVTDTVKSGDTFGNIIDPHLVDGQSIFKAAEELDAVYSVRRIQVGKPYKILKRKDSLGTPEAFIYEPTKMDYVVLNFADSLKAYKDKHPLKFVRKTASGVINSTLSEAMEEEGLGMAAIYELSDIYRWSIDFFRLQKGDRFKMIYTERYINDSIYAGIESIEAAVFETDKTPFYAFDFKTDSINNISDYYDENGKTLRSFFLKAPVNYSRISSRFTKRRFHPVQKRWKAHKGTDYAAAYGTPIVSTANGVVIKSGYTRGNGNYVKVKHNNTYSTQYLHMTKRKVKVGQRVKQGQVIGTVGSTGLATGPHVCYRFWVNGKQVDPYKQNLPSADPLPNEKMEDYLNFIQPLKDEIDLLSFKNDDQVL
ncbi:M23 family metallopeptidase [Nonlabens ulvanivorans]|uniref:Peptidase n=1 Tax=Nonlabens ulvanivorans TaxID=906888 RepID=A0A084JTB8_NONUL|nr:peptidoglycan DD-metalloendopeptidase family protein [Nonlabens ulvanivorans]KEZ92202.1 peptidase M23 [Nonlabens ulvanivorans]PRX15031.1 murein DD-endopeptidase MepM/ murein hydrolase activator NlpD [Nonlabens ulvanivorans]GAK98978.1 peptidase [Nonlabens ulvanivorans]